MIRICYQAPCSVHISISPCIGARRCHYDDVIMGAMASQITSLTSVYSTVYSCAHQSKHQSSASLAFVWGIHRGPPNYPHKWPVTRKMFPFDDVIMVVMIMLTVAGLCGLNGTAWWDAAVMPHIESILWSNAYFLCTRSKPTSKEHANLHVQTKWTISLISMIDQLLH